MFMTLTFCNLALALNLEDLESGDPRAGQNVLINKNYGTGQLQDISYVISSTGATSGTRYRTSAVTVTIGGHTATIDISSLVGTAPAGSQLYSLITISKEDILSKMGASRSEVKQILNLKPGETLRTEDIKIGANIQIYNAGTGAVLATITNRSDVASVAGGIGFGSKDISDMESRWQSNPVVIDPEPEGSGRGEDGKQLKPGDQGYGLRPSVLIDDDDPRYSPTSPNSVNAPYR